VLLKSTRERENERVREYRKKEKNRKNPTRPNKRNGTNEIRIKTDFCNYLLGRVILCVAHKQPRRGSALLLLLLFWKHQLA
jgi:hypothetical protein